MDDDLKQRVIYFCSIAMQPSDRAALLHESGGSGSVEAFMDEFASLVPLDESHLNLLGPLTETVCGYMADVEQSGLEPMGAGLYRLLLMADKSNLRNDLANDLNTGAFHSLQITINNIPAFVDAVCEAFNVETMQLLRVEDLLNLARSFEEVPQVRVSFAQALYEVATSQATVISTELAPVPEPVAETLIISGIILARQQLRSGSYNEAFDTVVEVLPHVEAVQSALPPFPSADFESFNTPKRLAFFKREFKWASLGNSLKDKAIRAYELSQPATRDTSADSQVIRSFHFLSMLEKTDYESRARAHLDIAEAYVSGGKNADGLKHINLGLFELAKAKDSAAQMSHAFAELEPATTQLPFDELKPTLDYLRGRVRGLRGNAP